jgi:hypothetical protein
MTTKSEFADVRFKVHTILNDTTSFLMTLKKGTTMGEAQKLVEHLNQVVEQISIQP